MTEQIFLPKSTPFVGGMFCQKEEPLQCPHYLQNNGVSRACYMIHYPQENFNQPRLDYKCKFLDYNKTVEPVKGETPNMEETKKRRGRGKEIPGNLKKAIMEDMIANTGKFTAKEFSDRHDVTVPIIYTYSNLLNKKLGKKYIHFTNKTRKQQEQATTNSIIEEMLKKHGLK